MHLARRIEDGRLVREIEWTDGASTDLGVLVFFLVAASVCGVSSFGAAQTHGWVRTLLVLVAVASGVIWLGWLGLVVVFGVVAAAMRAHRITAGAETLMAVTAAAFGAAIGSDAYQIGPSALAFGPVIAVLIGSVLWQRLPSRTARLRFIAMALVGVLASTAVGATLFI